MSIYAQESSVRVMMCTVSKNIKWKKTKYVKVNKEREIEMDECEGKIKMAGKGTTKLILAEW